MKHALLLAGVFTCTAAVAEPQALTCSEAADKVEKIEPVSAYRSVVYQNFYTQVHHSDTSHSLRSKVAAQSIYYNKPAEDVESHRNTMEMVGSLIQRLNSFIEGNDGESSVKFSNEMAAVLHAMGYLREVSPRQMEGGIPLTSDYAEFLKDEATTVYQRLSNQVTNFIVRLARDENSGLSLVFFWGEHCEPNEEPTSFVYPVNDQNVKFDKRCLEKPEINITVITPSTEKGIEYVTSEFKKKMWVEIPVLVDEEPYRVKFWASGFTKSWNQLGGDAL